MKGMINNGGNMNCRPCFPAISVSGQRLCGFLLPLFFCLFKRVGLILLHGVESACWKLEFKPLTISAEGMRYNYRIQWWPVDLTYMYLIFCPVVFIFCKRDTVVVWFEGLLKPFLPSFVKPCLLTIAWGEKKVAYCLSGCLVKGLWVLPQTNTV